jgi:hypothetical protein
MMDRSEFRPDLTVFGVTRGDPGWIYFVRHKDLLKVGKTKNPRRRLTRDAKTWLPDLEVVGCKPFWNITFVERCLHVALVRYWYDGEWYKITDKDDRDFYIEGFLEFYEKDPDMNSVDFIYWMNGSGMAEFCHELCAQKLTLPQFQRQESGVKKPGDPSQGELRFEADDHKLFQRVPHAL